MMALSAPPFRRAGHHYRRRLRRSALQSGDRPRDRLRHKAVLCVPLCTAKGDIIGVAQALNKAGGLFTEHDQALLEGIAAQSIPALRSSQTVERMQKARAQELAFLDIVADITSQIDSISCYSG